ncbi:MAG: tRNA (adenosine(37)-N6)-dimethylallyltransferase MiaA [Holophagae bacterium]|nr:MAG: tRNA (adenosine(37)-N6)-dimethylallyltransferase MiaA [Holophagae bacterium]
MDAATPQLPLLVIMGPTGSGKSELALQVAEAIGGEIISADAFAVYRGLDIGTDKPPIEARRRVRHHLLDVADPHQRFSAGHFVAAATSAIDDIRSRGAVPMVAGGTHFYVRALLLGLFESPPGEASLRARLAAEWDADPARTADRLRAVDPAAAARIGAGDRQRVLRALEVWELTGVPISEHWRRHQSRLPYHTLLVAPHRERRDLYARIDLRVVDMFSRGLEEEVTRILASGVPASAHALKAIGYAQVVQMLAGGGDRPTAIEQTKQASRRLAKRQLTWLRSLREGALEWVAPVEHGGAESVVAKWLGFIGEGSEP